jgi:tape measure domain-containing protein
MGKSTTIDMILRARDEASLTFEQVGKLTENLAKLQKTLATEFLGTGKAAAELEKEMGRVGRAEKSITDMARSLDKLADTRTKLAELGTAAEQLKGKLAGIEGAAFEAQSRGVSPKVLADMAKLGQAAERTAQQIAQAETRLAALGGKIIAGTATESQRASFDAVRAKIAELEQDYRLITREAEKAGAALKTSLGPIPNDLNAALRKTGAELRKTEADMARAAQAANRLEQELTEAGVDTRDLAAAQQRLAGTAGQLKAAQEGVAGATTRAGAAQDRFASGGRTATAVTQGLRTQVLGLISAYAGLHAVAGQVGEVFSAASEEQTISLRFSSAFGGDADKVEQAMAYLRTEAERLQVSFLGAGDEFSKFVSALPPGRHQLEEVMKVFTGFSTAGVALGLSNENMQRVFLALTQMAGKGTVQMEELKQQLGEAMPPALNLFAEAAGFSTDRLGEFYDLLASGGLRSDILFKVADLMIAKYGDQIPEALKKPAAALRAYQLQIELLRLEVAKSGFIDTLTESLRKLSDLLKEPDVRQSMKDLAGALGTVIKALVAMAPHLGKIIALFVSWQTIKLAAWITTISTGMSGAAISAAALGSNVATLGKGLVTLLASATPVTRALLLMAAALGFMRGTGADLDETLKEVRAQIDGLNEAATALPKLQNLDLLSNDDLESEIRKREELLQDAGARMEELVAKLNPESGPPLVLQQVDIDAARESLETYREAVARYTGEIEQLQARIDSNKGAEAQAPLFVGSLKATGDNIKAVGEALTVLEDMAADSNINRINGAFNLMAAALGEAGENSRLLVQLEQERAEAIMAIEQHRSDRILQIRAAEAHQKIELLRQEGLAGEELARAQQEVVAEVSAARAEQAKRLLTLVDNQLDDALKLEKEYAKEVKKLRAKLSQELNEQADEGFQANIQGSSQFVAFQALEQRRNEIAKAASDTRRAFEAGEFKQAEELARRRKELAKSIAEVEITSAKTGDIIVRQSESRARADREIKSANDDILKAISEQIKGAEEAGGAQSEWTRELSDRAKDLRKEFEGLQGETIAIHTEMDAGQLEEEIARIKTAAMATPLITKLELDDEAALVKLAKLQEPTESTHTVRLALDASGLPQGLANMGGAALKGLFPFIGGHAAGGKIEGPGTATSDSILARLSRGEYVIKAAAVDYWGEDMIRRINMMQRLPLYATGGMAGSAPDLVAPLAGGAGGEVVTLNLSINNREVGEFTGEKGAVDTLIDELRRLK